MTHTSWEVLKLKYQVRILESAKAQFKDDKNIVISFMGSSVTAGHDSPFNISFPILTQVNLILIVFHLIYIYISLLTIRLFRL